jgi:Uma2 family endonuclease
VTEVTIDLHHVWTEADLGRLPDDGSRYEIVDGRLVVVPPASEAHQARSGSIYTQLMNASPQGWRVLYEIGLAVSEDRFVPDLLVLPPGTPPANSAYNEASIIKPQLIVEIASRSTETTDAGNKVVAYARAEVPAYWPVVRDGKMYLHALMDAGSYGLIATIAPGESHDVRFPFPLSLRAPD